MSKEIQQMFASIAARYDLANDVLSGGIHRLWRRKVVRRVRSLGCRDVLDLCTGTGDLALALADALGPNVRVVGVDFVHEMVELAEKKRLRSKHPERVAFSQGDALAIPLPPASVDAVTISFGIRNVDDVPACLREIRRALRPGGSVFVLEFGQVRVPIFRALYDWYGRHIMPAIGRLLTGNRDAYEYLPQTALRFPAGREFLRLLEDAGFERAKAASLLGGLAYIYSGTLSEFGSKTVADRELAAA